MKGDGGMKSRFRQTMLNSGISVVTQFSSLVLKFVTQTFFIMVLGSQFLGTQSFFVNLMTFLSCFEFGVSSAFVFALYEPLAHQRKDQITALLQLLRYIYHRLAIVSGMIGLLIMLGLHLFHYESELVAHWQVAYLLVLANYLLFFLNENKRQLLVADQLSYVSVLNQCVILLVQTGLQIACLLWWPNYLIFLAIQLVCTLVGNWVVSLQVWRRYPFLKEPKYRQAKISTSIMTKLKKNLKGVVSTQMSTILSTVKDGLLISLLVSVHLGGIFANYTLIVSGITLMLTQLIKSATASVGNLMATTDEESVAAVENVLRTHYFINFCCTLVAAACLLGLLNPFITLWIGAKYVLPNATVILIVLVFACNQMRQTGLIFINAYGLFFQEGIKAAVEIVVSITLSVMFVLQFHLGINGILFGTLISHVGINLWWEPLIVYHYGLHRPIKTYWLRTANYWVWILAILAVIVVLPSTLVSNAWLNMGLLMAMLVSVSCLWLYVGHRRKQEFDDTKSLMFHLQDMIVTAVRNR